MKMSLRIPIDVDNRVEFQNGAYFMVDMGSTNGVEFNGQRIARKQIGEGDVFRICDHDILFTYR